MKGLYLLLPVLSLAACSESDRVEIKASRPRHSSEKEPRLNVPYEDAFPAPEQFRWTKPPGWKEVPGTQFRNANFSFGPHGEGECYVSSGAGGGTIENLNRWRAQMGQPELTAAQVAELPVKKLFGAPGRFLDISGTFTGAGGMTPQPDYRLLGVVYSEGDTTVTVKMTGPTDLVEAEKENFDAFCASLRLAPGYPK
jgi:hypothetical protein